MKMLFDFLPIAMFFIVYKLYGIYIATGIAIVISLLQVLGYWLKFKRTETMQLVTLVVITLFGGATLLFHNEMFIKWKPSVIYWIFGGLFLASQFIGKKTVIQRIMDHQVTLPLPVWRRLNISWALFMIILGFLNILVALNFSTDAWVNFKFFGAMGLTLVFIVLQSLYIAKYMKEGASNDDEHERSHQNH